MFVFNKTAATFAFTSCLRMIRMQSNWHCRNFLPDQNTNTMSTTTTTERVIHGTHVREITAWNVYYPPRTRQLTQRKIPALQVVRLTSLSVQGLTACVLPPYLISALVDNMQIKLSPYRKSISNTFITTFPWNNQCEHLFP